MADAHHAATLFFKEIVRLHGVPWTITFDHDVHVVSYFWKSLWALLGTKLHFSSTYHSQTNGQTEIVNRSLGNLLRCLICDHVTAWNHVLPTAKFLFNSAMNKTTGLNLFYIILIMQPNKPIDVLPLLASSHTSKSTEAFARHIWELYIEIRHKISCTNDKYKSMADKHYRFHTFQEGDQVMVWLRVERLPLGSIKNLHVKSIGPYMIILKISDNFYVVDSPKNLGISAIFNVKDISLYHPPTAQMEDVLVPPHPTAQFPLEYIVECIMDDHIIVHPDNQEQRYLVKWVTLKTHGYRRNYAS